MIASHLIWLPSIRKFKRYAEFTTKDQIALSKTNDDIIEFVYHLNVLLKSLMVDDDYKFEELTLIDKYVLAVQLRIHCMGESMQMVSRCQTCEEDTNISIDANEFITKNIQLLERDYSKTFTHDAYTVTCQIPRIGHEYNTLLSMKQLDISKDEPENILEYQTLAHIKEVTIGNVTFNPINHSIEDSMKILRNLPIHLMTTVQRNFLFPLRDEFQNKIFTFNCKTENCEPIIMDLSTGTINQILKMLYNDSPSNIIREIYYLSVNSHINPEFCMNITPIERQLMIQQMLKDHDKGGATNTPNFHSRDNNIHLEESGMEFPVSESEFQSW